MSFPRATHWLDRYASGYHQWKDENLGNSNFFIRPLGLVETLFDNDGRNFEGRADIHGLLKLKIKCIESKEQLRRRILLAWTILRIQHPLLRATRSNFPLQSTTGRKEKDWQRCFAIKSTEKSPDENLQQSSTTIVFAEDVYEQINPADFLKHAENTGRVINPSQSLSKLFALPQIELPDGTSQLPLFFVFAHQIADGLTLWNWLPHFHVLLNEPLSSLSNTLSILSSPHPPPNLQPRLPPAQEDLYPLIPGSRARRHWSWLLHRILRHTHHPLPPALPNPLLRAEPLPPGHGRPMPPTYPRLLNYNTTPPLNTHRASAVLCPSASSRFHALARTCAVSLGAMAFALTGLVMQTLHAELHLHPHYDSPQQQQENFCCCSFIGSFPLNPRAFWHGAGQGQPPPPPDSLMLAFSAGLVLPFLPTDASVEARLRVLARRAQAQLRRYQRREMRKGGGEGARRVLQELYLWTTERSEVVLGEEERMGWDVQGSYPARPNPTGATCGVSWVGEVEMFMRGPMDKDNENLMGRGDGGKEFEALWMDVSMGVRAREREFLVGGTTHGNDRVVFGVSYDGNAYDEVLVRKWEERMRTILLDDVPDSRL